MADLSVSKSPGLSNGQSSGPSVVDSTVDLSKSTFHDDVVSKAANPVLNSQGNDAWIANRIKAPDVVVDLIESSLSSSDGEIKVSKTTTSDFRSVSENAVSEGLRAEQFARGQGATEAEAQKAKSHAETYVTSSGQKSVEERQARQAAQEEMRAEALEEAEAVAEDNKIAEGLAEGEAEDIGIADAQGIEEGIADGNALGEREALAEGIGAAEALGDREALAEAAAIGVQNGLEQGLQESLDISQPLAEMNVEGAALDIGNDLRNEVGEEITTEAGIDIGDEIEAGIDQGRSAGLEADVAVDVRENLALERGGAQMSPLEAALLDQSRQKALLEAARAERQAPTSKKDVLRMELAPDESEAWVFGEVA